MLFIKINGVEKTIPTCWDDLNFKQYAAIIKAESSTDYEHIFALMVDIDIEMLRNAKLIGFEKAIAALSFMKQPPEWKDHEPFLTTPDGGERFKTYHLPEDITLETIAQYEDMKVLFKKAQDKAMPEYIDDYTKYCAIYCQPIRDGQYDYGKAMAMASDFYQYRAREVVQVGNFFMVKLYALTNGIKVNYRPRRLTLKAKFRNLTAYVKVSVLRLF